MCRRSGHGQARWRANLRGARRQSQKTAPAPRAATIEPGRAAFDAESLGPPSTPRALGRYGRSTGTQEAACPDTWCCSTGPTRASEASRTRSIVTKRRRAKWRASERPSQNLLDARRSRHRGCRRARRRDARGRSVGDGGSRQSPLDDASRFHRRRDAGHYQQGVMTARPSGRRARPSVARTPSRRLKA